MKIGMFVLVALLAGIAHAAPDNERSSDTPAPLESYVGHYLTGQAGEGVFIEHAGGPKSFLTYVTYAPDGQATWFVMPDARWQVNEALSRSEFAGQIFRVRRGDESPPSLRLTVVGSGSWYPSGPDTLKFTAIIDGNQNTSTLRRFRL